MRSRRRGRKGRHVNEFQYGVGSRDSVCVCVCVLVSFPLTVVADALQDP